MRIEPVSAPYEPEIADALARMMPPNTGVEPLALFRILANHPRLGQRMTALGAVFLRSEQLSLRERELVILRTTARTGCEYEWGVHVSWLAKPAGLSDAEIAATTAAQAVEHFAERDALLIRAVDELHASARVTDALWAELSEHWSAPALVELVALIGFYHLISFVANATQASHEPWSARFPAG